MKVNTDLSLCDISGSSSLRRSISVRCEKSKKVGKMVSVERRNAHHELVKSGELLLPSTARRFCLEREKRGVNVYATFITTRTHLSSLVFQLQLLLLLV